MKRAQIKLVIILLITLILISFFITLIYLSNKSDLTGKAIEEQEISRNCQKILLPITEEKCEKKEFAYKTENYYRKENNEGIEVNFDIINLENEKGVFYYQTLFLVQNEKYGCHAGTNQWDAHNRKYNNELGEYYSGFRREILAQDIERVFCSFKKATDNDKVETYEGYITVIPPTKEVCKDIITYKNVEQCN